MRRFHLVSAALLSTSVACTAQSGDPRESLYFHSPDVHVLMDWVTFYHSFDHESFVPDMAAGNWKFSVHGKPELGTGLLGKALIAGSGALMYPASGNWTVTTRGAASFWLCPVRWDHRNAGLTNFLLSSSAALYLERQGPLLKADGQWERQEALLFGLQRGPTGNVAAGCSDWKDGVWHLVVVNWSWPRIEMSVDGSAFAGTELRGKPEPGLFGELMLGSVGGDPTLLDEVFLYRRPLTVVEARCIFEALSGRQQLRIM